MSSGGRFGAYRGDVEAPYEASVSGRRLEIDEHLLNVLLMEYSESFAGGVPGGRGMSEDGRMHVVDENDAANGAGIEGHLAYRNSDGREQSVGPLEDHHKGDAPAAEGGHVVHSEAERGDEPCAPFAG